MKDFVITSDDLPALSGLPLELISEVDSYKIWGSKKDFVKIENLTIYIDGYVLPRRNNFDALRIYDQYELIEKLYSDYGKDFIRFLKGSFIIILIRSDEIEICNDINSIQKFFVFNSSTSVSISNNVLLINLLYKLELNYLYPAVQALFQHPVKGITMFKDLQYSDYATYISLKRGFKVEKYWTPVGLFEMSKDSYSMKDLINLFRQNICDHVQYFKPEKVSLTLTGGRDTRSVLSALLNLNIYPHAFTFGNPDGTDVTTAKNICSKLNLQFSNHYIEDIKKEYYDDLIDEINKYGNPLIHLHRAHRLDAIKKEKKELGRIDMLFVGAMGGDFIKGVGFNDYIVTRFMRLLFFDKRPRDLLIKGELDKHCVNYNAQILSEIIELIDNLEYLDNHSFKKSEFLLAHSFISALHDSQDLFVFSKYSQRVVAPFMDIDFIEALFQSKYSLLSNSRSSKNPLLKLKGGEFQANLIRELYRPLAFLPMANRYKPNDLLGNQYIYMLKRMVLKIFKSVTIPTFTYEGWYHELIESYVSSVPQEIQTLYDIDKLLVDLGVDNHKTTEGYWHKYSNLVMILKWINFLRSYNYAGSNIKK